MKRDEALEHVLQIPHPYVLLQYPTGYGKSRLAIERVKRDVTGIGRTLLIVVYREVHKKTWKVELKKWWADYEKHIRVEFTTYAGMHNKVGTYDYAIFDECHHLTERCLGLLKDYLFFHVTFLSATVKDSLIQALKVQFRNLCVNKIDLREAIDEEVLPDPTVYLIPMTLKSDFPTESLWKNPKAKGRVIECSWAERWKFIKQKNFKIRIYCTQFQYVQDLNSQITYWKNLTMRTHSEMARNRWMRLCLDRLKYLSEIKTSFVRELLEYLKDYRTLTFCNGIEHTKQLGENYINSKNKNYQEVLDAFNEGKIKHITACDMLNEGMNLTDCRVGIYANLNSSDTLIKQKTGRLLRHTKPVIIIPYYKGTREQEIVESMLENYNPELVKIINFKEEIQL